MHERERQVFHEDPGAGRPAGADGLESARAEAERLFAAADEAIARALSSDSQAFLQANRQSGGQ
jgi:hypothetical protein